MAKPYELGKAKSTIRTLQGKVAQLSAPPAPPSRKRQREEEEEIRALHSKVRRMETLITSGQRKSVAGRKTRQPPIIQSPAPPRTSVLKFSNTCTCIIKIFEEYSNLHLLVIAMTSTRCCSIIQSSY